MSFIAKRWRQFVAGRVARDVGSSSFQERLDTYRAYLLTSYHRHKRDAPLTPEGEAMLADVAEVESEADKLGYFEQKVALRKNIEEQMLELFRFLHDSGGMDPYPQPLSPGKEESVEMAVDDATYHTEMELARDALILDKPIHHPSKRFTLHISKSKIDHAEAGFGVHAKGNILPGTVIGIYAGTVHFPYTLTKSEVKDNNYIYGRYDGVAVDGRDWERKAFAARRLQRRLEVVGQSIKDQGRHLKFRNPFGIAQYINHPPPGSQPNVMCYAFEFSDNFPDELKLYVPHEHAKKPNIFFNTLSDCYIRSIVCLATRHIADEELYLNYRYNPVNPYPDWYEQPDLEEAQRRWKRPRLFTNPFW